jgi:hypothetical protein
MTQRQGGTSVLPNRDDVDQPVVLGGTEEGAARVAEPRRNRLSPWLLVVAAAALIALGIAAALTGANPEPVSVAPQERSNALVEPLGSDQHLSNQAARVRAEGTVIGSDQHLSNQAARINDGGVKALPYMYAAGDPSNNAATKHRFQAPQAAGSDRHLENQAAKLAG